MLLGGLLPPGEPALPTARRRRADELDRRPRRPVRDRRRPTTASPTTTSARATRVDARRLPHRAPAGDQRHLAALRRGRRLRAPRVVVRRGLGVEGGVRHHALSGRGGGPPGRSGLPRLLVRGRRLRPLRTERGSPPKRSGRRRRPGPRTSRASGRSGSGPPRTSAAIPASSRHPYREYSEVFFGDRLPRPARRLVGDRPARRDRHVPQLGPPPAPADLRRRPTGHDRRRADGAAADHRRASSSSPSCGPEDERTLADDVLDGLTRPFKELPPKHFYDARGAELFDPICELPEYYPTRAERAILERAPARSWRRTGAAELVELGSGTAAKTRLLLRRDGRGRARCDRYVPIDVTESMVRATRRRARARSSPGCACTASSATSSATSRHVPPAATARASSPSSAARSATSRPAAGGASCARSPSCCGPDGHLLLGTDLVKDPASSRPPTTTAPASPRSSTATSCTCSTASSTPTSTSTPSSTSRSSTASASGSRCACARDAPQRRARRPARPRRRLRRRARSCAPRSARSSRPSAWAATSPPPGSSCATVLTDPDELFALSLARVQGD